MTFRVELPLLPFDDLHIHQMPVDRVCVPRQVVDLPGLRFTPGSGIDRRRHESPMQRANPAAARDGRWHRTLR